MKLLVGRTEKGTTVVDFRLCIVYFIVIILRFVNYYGLDYHRLGKLIVRSGRFIVRH